MQGGTYGAFTSINEQLLQTGGPVGAEVAKDCGRNKEDQAGSDDLSFIAAHRPHIGLVVVFFHMKYL